MNIYLKGPDLGTRDSVVRKTLLKIAACGEGTKNERWLNTVVRKLFRMLIRIKMKKTRVTKWAPPGIVTKESLFEKVS